MRLPILAACLFAAGAASAQNVGERLLMNAPQGWGSVPVHRGENMVISRLYPPGETEKAWSQSITVQAYMASDQSARSFVEGIISYSRDTCEAAGPGPVTETQNNGYPAAMVTVTCTRGPSGQGSFVLVQAIRGRDALYVVQRQWRGPAFGKDQSPAFPPNMLKDWGEFAKTVSLCDNRDPKHPCPK